MQKAKEDVELGAFMRVFLNFLERIFHRTNSGDCISKDIYSILEELRKKIQRDLYEADTIGAEKISAL